MAQEPDRLTPDSDDADAPPEAAQIERDIERTRAEMSETIDAIGARFQPAYIRDQAVGALRDTARDAGTTMMDRIRDNPLPAAVAALSIGWLLFAGDDGPRRRRDGGYRGYPDYGSGYGPGYGAYGRAGYGSPSGGYAGSPSYRDDDDGPSLADRARHTLHDARDAASDALDHVRGTASDALGGVRDRASDLGGHVAGGTRDAGQQVQVAGRRAASWLEDQMDRNPLGVGAVALAAGALVGLSVPSTDAEGRLFGEKAEALKGQVREVAGDKLEQAKEVAQQVVGEVKEVAQTVAGDVTEKAKEVAQHATEQAKTLAGQAGEGDSAQGGAQGAGGPSAPGAGDTSGEHVANVNRPDADRAGDPA